MVQPVTLYRTGGAVPVIKVRASSAYDGFGAGYTATADGSASADVYDAVGFGGQAGYERDEWTGLYSLRHRYYDAQAGRFLNRDPVGYKGGVNLYGFCGNNPVNQSDPEGYDPSGATMQRPPTAPSSPTSAPKLGQPVRVPRSARYWSFMRGTGGRICLIATLALYPYSTADSSTGPGSPYYIQQHSDPAVEKSIERHRKKLEQEQLREARVEDASPVRKAADILAIRAAALGYTRRLSPQPFSHGQTVFSDGNNYISRDVDAHNVTNGWKMFDKKGNRLGTYDSNLNRVKR